MAGFGQRALRVWRVGKKGKAKGRPESEKVEVSSKEGHVPDHLPRRKDKSLCSDHTSLRRDYQLVVELQRRLPKAMASARAELPGGLRV